MSDNNIQSKENKNLSISSGFKESNTFFNENEINTRLTSNIISIGHLRIYLQMRYTSLRQAGEKAGLSYERVRQIVTGHELPQRPDIIKRIALAWRIDPIKLTQLFERYRNE